MAVPASNDDVPSLRWHREALMDKLAESLAIGTALRMPLGSMVSLILKTKPCECEALCTCDQPNGR